MANLSTDPAHSNRGCNSELEWRDILQSLSHGQYDRAESFLTYLQQSSSCTENPDLKVLLTAALLLCLNCAHLKSQADEYRISYQDALSREQALCKQLTELLIQAQDWYLSHPSNTLKETWEGGPKPPISKKGRTPLHSIRQIMKSLFSTSTAQLSANKTESLALEPPLTVAEPVQNHEQITPELELPPPASLFVFCLGKFQVYLEGQLITTWPASKGKSIFKYLVTHRENSVAKDILMDLFWQNSPPESARRNLNWAIHNLRQILHKYQPNISHVIFQDECYFLNPDLRIWIDVDDFEAHIEKAHSLKDPQDINLAVQEYQAAHLLYHGEFLEEDRYEDWVQPRRSSVQNSYLQSLDCLSRYHYDQQHFDEAINLCSKMLATDPCREEAHMCLMQCYYRQGQPYLAIRQYQLCLEKLKTELDVSPSQNTTRLYEAIRLGKCDFL